MTDQPSSNGAGRPRADGAVQWLEETVVEAASRAPRPRRQGSVLAAAMIAVGEIIEPDKVSVDIETHVDAPDDRTYDLPFTIGFGNLPDPT